MPAATPKLHRRNNRKLHAATGFVMGINMVRSPAKGKQEGNQVHGVKFVGFAAAAAATLIGATPAGAAHRTEASGVHHGRAAPNARGRRDARPHLGQHGDLCAGARRERPRGERAAAWQSDDPGPLEGAGTEIGYNRLTNVTDLFVASSADRPRAHRWRPERRRRAG